jgi:hypothetical protein
MRYLGSSVVFICDNLWVSEASKMMPKTTKSQSILEYLIVLTAIIVAFIATTVGFRSGLQHNLDVNQKAVEERIESTTAPAEVKTEPYYTDSRQRSDSNWYVNADTKNISPAFQEGRYYFHEGNSDMSYVDADGTVLDTANPPGPKWGHGLSDE